MRTNVLFRIAVLFSLALFTCKTANPNASSLQANSQYEPYSDRPSIHSVSPKNWNMSSESVKQAQLRAAAFLSAAYPEEDVFILGRDGEYIFDLLQLIDSNPSRFHLLNISRANMKDPLLKSYMAQEGLLEKNLTSGKRAVVFDTGRDGSIFNQIRSLFPQNALQNLKFQMIVSNNPAFPSMRTFLLPFTNAATTSAPVNLHSYIVNYEHQAHYTHRSTGFLQQGGRIEPVVTYTNASDTYDPATAKKTMEELRYFASLSSVEQAYQEYREMFAALRTALSLGGVVFKDICQSIVAWHSGNKDLQEMAKAAILDVFEVQQKNVLESFNLNVSASDLITPSSVKPSAKPYGKTKSTSTSQNSSSSGSNHDLSKLNFSTKLSSGVTLKTPKGLVLQIAGVNSEGSEYITYLAKDKNGKIYIVKTSITMDSKQSEEIKDEGRALGRLRKIDKSWVPEVFSVGQHFIVKEFIEGTDGGEWIKDWVSSGTQPIQPVSKLRGLLQGLANESIYVGELVPSNFVWTGSRWVIVNSGAITETMSTSEVLDRYKEKLSSRWGASY